MTLPKKFKLLFSEGAPKVEELLHHYVKKLPSSGALKATKKLLKEVSKVSEGITASDLPTNLELALVNDQVDTGVFLKPDYKSISAGTLIGVYTGIYELVPADLSSCNSYAYDVMQEIRLKKSELKNVTRHDKPLDTEQDYSIQTNAIKTGNFTRFINHSSLQPNIEAIVTKFPDSKIEILLFSSRKINPGEQLLSNYGGHYWKALHIIPTDMSPSTYMLNSSHKAYLANRILPTSPKIIESLLPLRNGSTETSDKIFSTSIFKKFKKKISPLAKKYLTKTEEWENTIVERGLPRDLSLTSKKKEYFISPESPLRKGSFIGALAGNLSLKKTSHCIALAKTTRTELFLDLSKETNALSLLKEDQTDSNVYIRPMFDKDTDTLHLILLTSKEIAPGDPLSLAPFKLLDL
jgi:hypothetical protein